MVLLTTWWITRPLRRLMEHVAAVKAGGRPPLPPLGSDEMGRLGAAFDDLCASLDGRAYIERYVQTLTHELKSPLAAIRGAAELLDEDLPPDDRRRFLANIRTETGRLQDLAERLLELAALERRSEALRNDTIAAEALIADVVESLHPQTVTKGVAVQVTIHPGIAVRGERFLIRQALANLLQNAIAFSPAGGVITIAAQPQDGRTAISIRDQGPGIPDFAHERIFERFFSLARPDTGRKGTGLGLTFVREVALRHGGTITLANHPDGGTIADLRLPGAISADGR
jgi:two-component system sensor histidine kinase CreC